MIWVSNFIIICITTISIDTEVNMFHRNFKTIVIFVITFLNLQPLCMNVRSII